MHVGHLAVHRDRRCPVPACSTHSATGSSVEPRRRLGHAVGMLIEHLVDLGEEKAVHELSSGDLTTSTRSPGVFDADADLPSAADVECALAVGDPETLGLWKVLVDQSVAYFDLVYTKARRAVTDDDVRGESFYNRCWPGWSSISMRPACWWRTTEPNASSRRLHQFARRPVARDRPESPTRDSATRPPHLAASATGWTGSRQTDAVRRRGAAGPAPADVLRSAAMAGWLPEGTRAEHVRLRERAERITRCCGPGRGSRGETGRSP